MKQSKTKRKNKITLIILTAAVLFLALIYLGGMIFFSSHFLPKTTINNINVSGMKSADVNRMLSGFSPSITLVGLNKDGETTTEDFDLRDLNEDISFDSSSLLNKQGKLTWFLSLFSNKDLACEKISGTYAKENIAPLLKNLNLFKAENIVKSQDASLSIENGEILINPAVTGNSIDENTIIELIDQRIQDYLNGNGNPVLDLNNYYEQPSLKEDDPVFLSLIEEGEKVLNKTITIDVTSSNSVSLDGETLADLLKYENNNLTYDQDHLSNYIHDFYYEYAYDSDGYISRSQLQTDLVKTLLSQNDESIEIEWKEQPNSGRIEVTIPLQRMDYYEDEVLILSSPIVSGNPDITDETIHGKYAVQRMVTDTYLMGRDYLEHVDYWMGFDETGRVYGLHDASWRDEFGGDIWLYDPSRGCVNMPKEKIAILFDYAQIGTEVYVHD